MLIALLLSFAFASVAVGGNNEFLNPPAAGVDVGINSIVQVKWRCDDCGSVPISLNIWQNKNDGNWAFESLLANVTNTGSFSWPAHTLEGLPIANGFHFELVYSGQHFDSGAMFIRDGLSVSSTPSPSAKVTAVATTMSPVISSTTIMISSIVSRATSTRASASASSSTSATSPSSSSGSDVTEIGLGVGLGIGIPFLLLIAGLVGYLVFKKRSRQDSHVSPQELGYEPHDKTYYAHNVSEMGSEQVSELRGDHWRRELHHESKPTELP